MESLNIAQTFFPQIYSFPSFPYLNNLDLSHTNITDDFISLLPTRAPTITHLFLKACTNLSNSSLNLLSYHYAQQLKRLSLDYNRNFLPAAVIQLIRKCKVLEYLSLLGCVPDSEIEDLSMRLGLNMVFRGEALKNLEILLPI